MIYFRGNSNEFSNGELIIRFEIHSSFDFVRSINLIIMVNFKKSKLIKSLGR